MKKYTFLSCITVIIILFLSFGKVFANTQIEGSKSVPDITVKARVLKITYDDTNEPLKKDKSNISHRQEFRLVIEEGKHKGEKYTLKNIVEAVDVYNIKVKENQYILVNITEDNNGKITGMHLFDLYREGTIYKLLAIFFIAIILIGGLKGLKSVLTLVLTGIIVIKVLLPLILKGYNPILITIICSIVIVCISMIGLNGINKKTFSSIIGTILGVFSAGVIALIAGNYANVTGLANDDAQMLAYLPQSVHLDFKGILFAGIIIGALGAVMDVSISIASSMKEIMEIKPNITINEYIKSGMNIGKDIMGTMANTLILAYAGGTIQLMLLFMAANTSLKQILNLDVIVSEIIKALAGSIGLVFTIPLTVMVCAFLNLRKEWTENNLKVGK
ncbi:YibE/F family protein [Clostridium sp. DJ247]|uniref:YibE/F family protein n=1 Tax=Clostridium sp. DJ247 TaxID=2726188 RepID=UPI0016289870|nr:YibE/F family protein [Clostridium sp. DJ247]MBC2581079.1 YibE/F family protein [Clostridium sp. DJ247]